MTCLIGLVRLCAGLVDLPEGFVDFQFDLVFDFYFGWIVLV